MYTSSAWMESVTFDLKKCSIIYVYHDYQKDAFVMSFPIGSLLWEDCLVALQGLLKKVEK